MFWELEGLGWSPQPVGSPALIWRLLDEERFLVRNLPGYAAYQGRVRYRLLPRIW